MEMTKLTMHKATKTSKSQAMKMYLPSNVRDWYLERGVISGQDVFIVRIEENDLLPTFLAVFSSEKDAEEFKKSMQLKLGRGVVR